MKEYNLGSVPDRDKMINDLIDAIGIDGLTETVLLAVTARKTANQIAERVEEGAKLSRIEQIYKDAARRVRLAKNGKE